MLGSGREGESWLKAVGCVPECPIASVLDQLVSAGRVAGRDGNKTVRLVNQLNVGLSLISFTETQIPAGFLWDFFVVCFVYQ